MEEEDCASVHSTQPILYYSMQQYLLFILAYFLLGFDRRAVLECRPEEPKSLFSCKRRSKRSRRHVSRSGRDGIGRGGWGFALLVFRSMDGV
jgi:hypothetical protein